MSGLTQAQKARQGRTYFYVRVERPVPVSPKWLEFLHAVNKAAVYGGEPEVFLGLCGPGSFIHGGGKVWDEEEERELRRFEIEVYPEALVIFDTQENGESFVRFEASTGRARKLFAMAAAFFADGDSVGPDALSSDIGDWYTLNRLRADATLKQIDWWESQYGPERYDVIRQLERRLNTFRNTGD